MEMANTLEREILERELRPRLCYLTKGDRGYGFHLHGERSQGAQYIRKIEPGSPADLSGLKSGDRVVEVNGENVEGETHQQVVQRILEVDHRTRLLVVDRVTDEFLKFHGLPCTEDRAIEMGSLSSRSSAASSPRASPRDCATPTYSRQSSEGILINKSPSAPGGVLNGSPLYRAHARLTSSLYLLPSSPSEPKTASFEPSTEPQTEPDTEDNVTDSAETSTDFSYDHTKTKTTTTQDEILSERDVVTKDLRPRLYHMTLSEHGYGFNLHCQKSRAGQYIRSVDPGSPAERVGLKPKDRLIEVNDRSIKGLRHAEVVALIKAGGRETRLLVVDPDTDELFKNLGITPTSTHLKEDCVDGPIIQSTEPKHSNTVNTVSASPATDVSRISPPIINITLTDPPINGSPRHKSYGSSSSHSTLSEISAELTSFETSNKVTDSDHYSSDEIRYVHRDGKSKQHPADSFRENGLHLSLTAAEARQKALAKRANKRAPPMDWSKKQEIFSNF